MEGFVVLPAHLMEIRCAVEMSPTQAPLEWATRVFCSDKTAFRKRG